MNSFDIDTFFSPKSKSILGLHDSVRLRYLFQLRVSFSHNFSHTLHYYTTLLHLQKFVRVIQALKTQVLSYLHRKDNLNLLANQVELYLYGHRTLNSNDNKKNFCQQYNT